eukprot:GILI01002444.1.p1 GENE.GILI01002444.1~~GILI01002444.1.p1  ORF type:complete len:608 (-),score=178.51 GILI01002444.1:254-2077(-)
MSDTLASIAEAKLKQRAFKQKTQLKEFLKQEDKDRLGVLPEDIVRRCLERAGIVLPDDDKNSLLRKYGRSDNKINYLGLMDALKMGGDHVAGMTWRVATPSSSLPGTPRSVGQQRLTPRPPATPRTPRSSGMVDSGRPRTSHGPNYESMDIRPTTAQSQSHGNNGHPAQSLKSAFRVADSEGSGKVRRDQLRGSLMRMNLGVDKTAVDVILNSVPEDGTGCVGYEDWCNSVERYAQYYQTQHVSRNDQGFDDGAVSVRSSTPNSGNVSFAAHARALQKKNEMPLGEPHIHDVPFGIMGDAEKNAMFLSNKLEEKFKKIQKAFMAFDENKDGVISKDEFMEAVENLNMRISAKEIDGLLQILDRNGNGSIDYHEFCQWLRPSGPMSELLKPKSWRGSGDILQWMEAPLVLIDKDDNPTSDGSPNRIPGKTLGEITAKISGRAKFDEFGEADYPVLSPALLSQRTHNQLLIPAPLGATRVRVDTLPSDTNVTHVYGKASLPSENMGHIMGHCFMREWVEQKEHQNQTRKETVRPKKFHTKSSLIRRQLVQQRQADSESVGEKPVFKMTRFNQVSPRTNTFRSSSPRGGSAGQHMDLTISNGLNSARNEN